MTDTQALVATAIDMLLWEHLKNVEGGLDLLDLRCLGLAGMMAVVVKLRPRVEGQAKTALMAALSGPQMHPKLAIAVDEDIDASDMRQVLVYDATRVHAERDVIKIPNARTWSLDNVSDIVPGQVRYTASALRQSSMPLNLPLLIQIAANDLLWQCQKISKVSISL